MTNVKTYNKLQSTNYINKMNLNKLPDKLFMHGNRDDLLKFLNEFPAKYYAIRNKSNSKVRKLNFKATKEDVLEQCTNMDLFAINVSSYNYKENQLLAGHVLITSDDRIYLTASDNKEYSVSDAKKDPKYDLSTFVDDKRLKHINGISKIIDYIMNYSLQDAVVEFAVFDTKLGTNNEEVIIYEIRTNY